MCRFRVKELFHGENDVYRRRIVCKIQGWVEIIEESFVRILIRFEKNWSQGNGRKVGIIK